MKLYQSKMWLQHNYKDKTLQEMADLAGCSVATIYNWLIRFEIIEKARQWKR